VAYDWAEVCVLAAGIPVRAPSSGEVVYVPFPFSDMLKLTILLALFDAVFAEAFSVPLPEVTLSES
jgi:hypothetical protein